MKVVHYTDEDGLMWAMHVKDAATDKDYQYGVVLGPYELDTLGLTKQQLKDLHRGLVEAGIYNAPLLLNKRKELLDVLKQAGLGTHFARIITSLFQRIYYEN